MAQDPLTDAFEAFVAERSRATDDETERRRTEAERRAAIAAEGVAALAELFGDAPAGTEGEPTE